MALKILMLRKKLEAKKGELNELREIAENFEKREKELETAIGEAETSEEEKAVEEEIEKFETEKEENAKEQETLQSEIDSIEAEMESIEKLEPLPVPNNNERKNNIMLTTRTKFFGMSYEERAKFFERDDVKSFLDRAARAVTEKRSVTGAELAIPDVMLDIIREQIKKYSKLINKVRFKAIKGTIRQNVIGTIPEGIWTEMKGALNELSFNLYQTQMDGYKVGGFIPIDNSNIEDNETLATDIMDALGQSIGYAIDKAIVYGVGNKQPLGIIPRLEQTSEPENYSNDDRPWVDLHVSNVKKINEGTNQQIWEKIVLYSGIAEDKYSVGGSAAVAIMNRKTKTALLSKLLSFNVTGGLVAQSSNQLPFTGGEIIELDFMADNDILFGFADLYLLVEREGATIESSEHVQFIQDNTVFKGTARYDGTPVIAEGFVLMNIANTDPTGSAEFPEDIANTTIGDLTVTSTASATTTGKTVIAVSSEIASGNTYKYKITNNIGKDMPIYGQKLGTGWTAWDGDDEIAAATGSCIIVAECKSSKAVKVGSTIVTAKA